MAKALGLVSGTDAGLDGTIELNPGLSYDADRSDGISASSYDLIGVIAHELGHVLGLDDLEAERSDLMSATLAPGIRKVR